MDQDPRKQLLESLLQELQNYQLPERYDEAKKAEIRRGRKGQAQIDEGRRAIAENERLYQEALAKRQELQTKIQTLSNDIDSAQATSRNQAQEDWERSPQGQAYEIGKWALPIAGGVYYGHRTTGKIEQRFQNMSVARQQAAGLGRRFAPYAGKSMTYFVPEGLALRQLVAPQMKEGTAKDIVNAGGTGLLAAGAVTAGEGLVRSLTPPKIPGVDDVPPQVPPPPPQNALDAAGRPPAPPPDEPRPAGPAPRTPNSARLIAAARAAGATGPLTKQGAADYLAANPGKATGAVAKALGVSNGPNLGNRIANAVKTMASTRGASGLVGPLLAGGLAYELAGEPADAADGSGAIPSTANRLAAAGGGAGLYVGMNKLAQALPQAVNTAFSAVGRMQPLMAIDEMTNLVPISDAENARAQGAENQTLNMLARNLPRALQPGPVRRAGEMAQVPPRNPMFHDVPDQPNAMAVAGDEPDAFGAALADFMALLRDGGFGEQEVMR